MKTHCTEHPYRFSFLEGLSDCQYQLRMQWRYMFTATKRIIFCLLLAQLVSSATNAQTTHSRWKQNFDIHEFRSAIIDIAPPSANPLQLHNIQGISVIDARADTANIGFMQKTVIEPFLGALNNAARNHTEQRVNKRPTFVILSTGLQKEASRFLAGTLAFPGNPMHPGILMVIKKLWLSDELNLNKGNTADRVSWSSSRDQWTSGVDISVEFYLGDTLGYYPLYRYDSVISKTLTVSEYGSSFLALALESSLQKMTLMDQKIVSIMSKKKFSLPEIQQHNDNAFDFPVLKDSTLKAGVYMSFEEFINNSPSQVEFEERKGSQERIVYLKQQDGTVYFAKDAWGYSDGRNAFIRSTDNYYLLQRMGNAFYIFGAKNVRWVGSASTAPSTYYPSANGNFYTSPSGGGSERELQLKPFMLDWSTGKLY